MILQSVEDFATIVKGEIDIAKKSLVNSVKKIGSGIGFFDVLTDYILSSNITYFVRAYAITEIRSLGNDFNSGVFDPGATLATNLSSANGTSIYPTVSTLSFKVHSMIPLHDFYQSFSNFKVHSMIYLQLKSTSKIYFMQ
jgi:hypothetical protein